MKNKLFNEFNNQDSLIMVSLYPNKGEVYSVGKSGVASYAKNIATNINRKVIVLSDYAGKKANYKEKNTFVVRCFNKHKPMFWIDLTKAILKFSLVKNILIQFDFSIYGSILTTSLIIPFLAILKLIGYKTYVIDHHVITDVKKISGHIGLTSTAIDKVKSILFNFIFQTFYRLMGLFSHKIIVLESALKQQLSRYINHENIVVIPHAVDDSLIIKNKIFARKKLNIPQNKYVVMFFGYVNWFKGADLFTSYFNDIKSMLGKKSLFLLAGGKSPTLKDKVYYQNYFHKVNSLIKQSKSIKITGYVPQNLIGDYFAACDIVIFPYRALMCASGVLSLAFSYQKPFLVSDELGHIFDSDDLHSALKLSDLKKEDIVFKLNKTSCINKTKDVLKNGLKKKMVHLTSIVKNSRSFENNSKIYESLIFDINYQQQTSPALNYN